MTEWHRFHSWKPSLIGIFFCHFGDNHSWLVKEAGTQGELWNLYLISHLIGDICSSWFFGQLQSNIFNHLFLLSDTFLFLQSTDKTNWTVGSYELMVWFELLLVQNVAWIDKGPCAVSPFPVTFGGLHIMFCFASWSKWLIN